MPSSKKIPLPAWARLLAGVVVLIGGAISYLSRGSTPEPAADSGSAKASAAERAPASTSATDPALLEAIRTRSSEVWVETDAKVVKLLPDDNDGSRHQRFLVETDGHSLLVAHNIDLAPRVPLEPGERIRLRARYEWNEKGGVLHWTHHDPGRRHAGGWIRVREEVYK
ncbi:MAG: DUF3465 domain-containing protein [Planctomycetes bacterium]|nr:DUF3465 domain-containing protein [Planctomycetota bacterium]